MAYGAGPAALITVSEAITDPLSSEKKAAADTSARIPDKVAEFGTFNIVTKKAPDGTMVVSRCAASPLPAELKRLSRPTEMSHGTEANKATLQDLAESSPRAGRWFRTNRFTLVPGMVVLDAVHRFRRRRRRTSPCAETARRASAGSCVRGINGRPKMMCMTRLSTLPVHEPVTVEPMRAFQLVRDLVTDVSWNFRVRRRLRRSRRPGDAADGTWRMRRRTSIASRNSEVHRVLLCPGRVPTSPRSQDARPVHRTALSDVCRGARENRSIRPTAGGPQGSARRRPVQHHRGCTEGAAEHITITETRYSLKERVAISSRPGEEAAARISHVRSSMDRFQLKPMSKDAVPSAIARAERYRC